MSNQMMADAAAAIQLPEIQEMMKKLASHGLGVFIPHMHTDDEHFAPLPKGVVQMESNLVVSFVSEDDPVLARGTVVGWKWDNDKAAVVATCACRGVHFPGSCDLDPPKPKSKP